jgi:hypothetical protein
MQPAIEWPSDERIEAWQWLVSALADELAATPSAEARYILDALDQLAGYHLVDELKPMYPRENARRLLVDRLMARFYSDMRTPRT